jgi:hypothetical protein
MRCSKHASASVTSQVKTRLRANLRQLRRRQLLRKPECLLSLCLLLFDALDTCWVAFVYCPVFFLLHAFTPNTQRLSCSTTGSEGTLAVYVHALTDLALLQVWNAGNRAMRLSGSRMLSVSTLGVADVRRQYVCMCSKDWRCRA